MKACFISGHTPVEVAKDPWGLTGEWCWVKAYNADVLNPRNVARDWGVLDKYDLIFIPGYIQTFHFLRELRGHPRPRGKIITWIDYPAELLPRLPAVQQDPTLPGEIKVADLIISPVPLHEPYYKGGDSHIVSMVHPVDGERLQDKVIPAPNREQPICLWVFHRWAPDVWPRIIPIVRQHPELWHIAIGLTQEGVEHATMYVEEAYTWSPRADYLALVRRAAHVVDMHPYVSMGRVTLEAASLGVPVQADRTPTCRVDVDNWYGGIQGGLGPVQAEQVKKHWIGEAKADLDVALKYLE